MRINTGCWVNGCKCFDQDDEDGVEIKRDREWQGLTGHEINECAAGCNNGNSVQDAIRKAEAKLREKNADQSI